MKNSLKAIRLALATLGIVVASQASLLAANNDNTIGSSGLSAGQVDLVIIKSKDLKLSWLYHWQKCSMQKCTFEGREHHSSCCGNGNRVKQVHQ